MKQEIPDDEDGSVQILFPTNTGEEIGWNGEKTRISLSKSSLSRYEIEFCWHYHE